ncbi:MAG: peptidylprolyl isomerase [Ignavibacterium sp.]|nr:peptidylprolyl isomerase [Ignavibacterium sp.]
MKSYLVFNIFFIGLIFSVTVIAQSNNKILAKIGSDNITVEEFQNRFDFMPHLNYSSSSIDSVKKEFLYSLIAEKLWALEADELQIDTFSTVRYSLKTLEKLFVKDEFYKKEVESKIKLSGNEISTGLSRVTRILNLMIITSPDSDQVWQLYDAFQKGASFDSVLLQKQIPLQPHQVKFGSFEDEMVEDVVFKLNLNEISFPVKANNNWFIFKLVDDQQDPSIDLSKDYARNIVIKKITDRKSQKLGRAVLDKLLGGKNITADRQIFDKMSDRFLKIVMERTTKVQEDSVTDIQLLESDILKLLASLYQTELNSSFIKLDYEPLTIKDFLYYAIYQKIYFDSFSSIRFKQTLNKVVKKFIEDEIISREGYKLGLQNLPSVQNDLRIWRNYYLSEVLMNSYADSIKISDSETVKITDAGESSTDTISQVNIIEILTDNIEDIEKIINGIYDGKDFKELASIFNKREFTNQSKGEWGYFDSRTGGEIGKIARNLEIGQIYGPIKVPEGYSIFKLIGKRKINLKQSVTIDKDSLKFIRVKLALSKMENLINKKTVALAEKFKIKLNQELLKNIETSEINTFTYRFIGFGGKIAAFPITIPIYEWYEQYKQKKEIP